MLLRRVSAWWVVLIAFLLAGTDSVVAGELRVRFTDELRAEPFTGRAYIFFTKKGREPRFGPDWFEPEPFLAMDVQNVRPGEEIVFSTERSASIQAFPKPLTELDLAGYRAQAVLRFNPLEREVGTGAGNGYSDVRPVSATEEASLLLTVDKLVSERRFEETKWVKLLRVRSARLSEFHGREVFLNAAVMLPASYYDQPERRYPTIFIVPGFGGRHFGSDSTPVRGNNAGVEFVRVRLDPSCPLGHCVFADSANNGPYGAALIHEFLPELDRQFRTIPEGSARFLTGHSSGGWSTLWLQITYPDHFGGTWSTAPDPVDFRDFQQIDIYRPGENMYVDAEGRPRPIARGPDGPRLWYRDFDHMEQVLGPGGQLHSFEAVFSPRGPDGQPMPLWDRQTGAIDPEVARAWEAYDLRLILERNWDRLGSKLAGKLHIHMGDQDTFYLEGATRRLKASLSELGSDAVVEIHTGKDHSTVMTPELVDRIRREIAEAFLKNHPAPREGVDRRSRSDMTLPDMR